MHLTCHNAKTQKQFIDPFRSARTDHRVLSCCYRQFLFLFCEKNKLGRRKKKTKTSYIHPLSHCSFPVPSAYVHMLHVRTTCTKKQWLPSGFVFDRMLSEWLISQCFDLLQLLELCLVRAWIWHTLQIIMWLHYIQCFFFFQFYFFFFFLFWKDVFMFKVLKFWYHTWLFYTRSHERLQSGVCWIQNKNAMCYIFAISVWILLIYYYHFFFLHWVNFLTPTNTLDLPSMLRNLFWIMLVHKTM